MSVSEVLMRITSNLNEFREQENCRQLIRKKAFLSMSLFGFKEVHDGVDTFIRLPSLYQSVTLSFVNSE